jgi:hypothetical protein
MSNDDESTPRWRMRTREQDRQMAAFEAKKRQRADALAVPIALDEPESTSPIDVWEREPSAEVHEFVRRSNRDSDAPVTTMDFAKWAVRADRKERAALAAPAANAALEEANPSIAGRVMVLEKRTTFWNRILWIVALAIGGGLFEAATRIWDRSAHETELQFRLQAVEKTLERLERTIDRDERRPLWAPQHSTKDSQP